MLIVDLVDCPLERTLALEGKDIVQKLVICALVGLATGTSLAQPGYPYVWGVPAYVPSLTDVSLVLDISIGGGTADFAPFGVLIRGDLNSFGEPGLNYGVLVGWGGNKFGLQGTLWGLQGGPNPNCADCGYVTPELAKPCCYPTNSPCRAHPEKCMPPPQSMPKLRKISAGWTHVLALAMDPNQVPATRRGLIAWGENDQGRPCDIPDFSGEPYNIEVEAKVVDISAGEYVNIVLFDNGKIVAWGDQCRVVGRTGVSCSHNPGGPPVSYWSPYEVLYSRQSRTSAPWRFKAIAAGGHFVMALGASGTAFINGQEHTLAGEVITWGSFDYSTGAVFGPNYRLEDEQFAQGPFPNSIENCGTGGPPPIHATYTPPYDRIAAGHVVCYGLKLNESGGFTVHGWGSETGSVRDLASNVSVQDISAGYSQWAFATLPQSTFGALVTDVATLTTGGYGCATSNPIPPNAPTQFVTDAFHLIRGNDNVYTQAAICYTANCDGSTATPRLTANDWVCLSNRYAAAQELPYEQQVIDYANCDASTGIPVLTSNDFMCFSNRYVSELVTPCPGHP